jgi:peroxiredoxin
MTKRIRVILLAVTIAFTYALSSAAEWNYRIDEPAPAFKLKSLDGKAVSMDDLRGQFVVLSFMTSWCPFCNAAAPHFEQLSRDYRGKNVRAMIVDIGEPNAPISKFAKKYSLSCTVLLDRDTKVAQSYAPPVDVAPDLKRHEVMIASFMIVDPEGKIRFLSLNEDTSKFDAKLIKLRGTLDALLAAQ